MSRIELQRADIRIVVIDYTCYMGERSTHRIIPSFIEWGVHDGHAEAQWVLHAWDVDRTAMFTFALSDIHSWSPGMH